MGGKIKKEEAFNTLVSYEKCTKNLVRKVNGKVTLEAYAYVGGK
jgi:hypothetical protein